MKAHAAFGRRTCRIAGLVAALVTMTAWPLLHDAKPLLPTDDLYTHLSVSRHLARGDGFLCDIAYPLSFAWPFARELPQPLVHRPPGWSVALLAPYAAAGGDPQATVTAVRRLQILLLAAMAGLGVVAWLERGRTGAAVAWLIALGFCPLLPYAVDWGQTELPAGLLLLAAWLRHRDGARRVDAIDGALTGALAMLRPEIAWLPMMWWRAWRPRLTAGGGTRRGWLTAAVICLALCGPWAVRNARLTGNPVFSVQAGAELVKDTRTWPGYDVYRQLTPQPAWRALRTDFEPIARKTARGLRFFSREGPGLMPWPLPLLLLAGSLAAPRAAGRRAGTGAAQAGARWVQTPAAVALASLAALMALYAPFDHSLRHLVALAPIVFWEVAPWLGEWTLSVWPERSAGFRRSTSVKILGALAASILLMAVTAREPTGWAGAARDAIALQEPARLEAQALRVAPAGAVCFVQTAAAPWFADRPAVWSPLDDDVAARISAWLAPAAPVEGKR